MIIFTVIVGVTAFAAGGLLLLLVLNIGNSPDPGFNGLFYCALWYPLLAIVAIIVCWTTKSISKSLIPFLALLPIYFISYYLETQSIARMNAANAQSAKEQQTIFNSATRDFTCSDGSFLNIGDRNDYDGSNDLNYFSTSTIGSGPSLIGTINKANHTFSILYRTADNGNILRDCKNTDGKSVMDLYTEDYISSAFTPTVFPVTKEEAIELVKNIPNMNHGSATIPTFTFLGNYHDDLEGQDILVVETQYAPNDPNNSKYYIFAKNGKIIFGR
jgi:hypothetical protein